MKILILWKSQSGKDTLAEIWQEHFWLSFISSSRYACKFIYPQLKDKYGYTSEEECFADRVNHRWERYDLINEYHDGDRTKMTAEILEINDCYVWMRNIEQFKACKHMFDLIIRVNASKRLEEKKGYVWISRQEADLSISNNWTLEQFKDKAIRLWSQIFI